MTLMAPEVAGASEDNDAAFRVWGGAILNSKSLLSTEVEAKVEGNLQWMSDCFLKDN